MTTTPQEPDQDPQLAPSGDPGIDPAADPDLAPGGDPEANPDDPKPGSGTTEDPS
ncbi:MAG TPA: hypothetical protein VHW64_04210 [Nocardioides sp.]|uniref:hypothetical protein n=1 Tax=Nocardioides sp. TaxID=35761 RepID=UPI002E381A54|nr:hypothetical protein [Nocardioides sp.]HEX3929881.1 hypothetical protein [Nocardioides sp.]